MWLWVARTPRDWPPAPRLVAMSPIDPGTGLDVKWIQDAPPSYLPPPILKSADERTERANAMIVTGLTLACTAMALFDLFLAALGS
jgi:hypothetical protein